MRSKNISLYAAMIIVVMIVCSSQLITHSYELVTENEYIVNDVKKSVKTTTTVSERITEIVKLPANASNSFKSFMDYKTITDKSSRQWKYQQKAHTDSNGLRKIGKYYCVALGSGISEDFGSKFKVTLSNGSTFNVILCEQKSDRHTDSTNRYIQREDGSINIIEFIVDTSQLPNIVQKTGNISYMPNNKFKGKIVKLEEIL